MVNSVFDMRCIWTCFCQSSTMQSNFYITNILNTELHMLSIYQKWCLVFI